jgi:hypothetical protein
VSFVARDASGADLPDTTVYVDDALVVTRIDGSLHDLDPGKHTVKFQNGTRERVLAIVLGSGEKGRALVATFPGGAASIAARAIAGDAPRESKSATKHPALSKPLVYTGIAFVAAGTTLAIVGLVKLPSNCSLSTRECAAPPGDVSIANASGALKMMDIGIVTGVVGLAAIATGVTWYVRGARTEKPRVAISPWLGGAGGGIAIAGDM